MSLVYLPINAAWTYVLTYSLTPVALAGFPMFYTYRSEAVAAAKTLGLKVSKKGEVS